MYFLFILTAVCFMMAEGESAAFHALNTSMNGGSWRSRQHPRLHDHADLQDILDIRRKDLDEILMSEDMSRR